MLPQVGDAGTAEACLKDPVPEPIGQRVGDDSHLKARAMGSLYVAGAVLALAWLLLARPADANAAGVLVPAAVAAGVGACLLAFPRFVTPLLFHAAGALGTLIITAVIVAASDGATPAAMLYVWIAVFAGYFSSARATAAHLTLAAVAYALILVIDHRAGPRALGWWLVVTGTATITGVFVWRLRQRLRTAMRQLANAARVDLLTGLMNRRGFHELLDTELERARRRGSPVALVTGDLDHFADVARRTGAAGADRALQLVGAALDRSRRRIDSGARIGGQEFAFVLPDTDEHGAFVVAERLRSAVNEAARRMPVPLTISFGVSCFPKDGDSPERLLSAACQASAAAKALGRDRSVIHSDEIESLLAERDSNSDRATEVQLATVLILAEALDVRDLGTARHCQLVGRFASAMGSELGLSAARSERLRLAGIVHDVGKIGIPDSILRKAGPLSEEEWEEMRRHPEIGARILSTTAFEDLRQWILAHHERPDGRGYPRGLTGEEIPLEARIIAVADAYEAMTADRPYRKALSPEEARQELRRGAGRQFEPRVVEAFIAWLDTLPGEKPAEPPATLDVELELSDLRPAGNAD